MTSTDPTLIETSGTDKKELIIGLDFGTAFTKVIIGDNRVRYAVPFDVSVESGNPYLLPSVLHINEDKSCSLISGINSSSETTSLKLPLLDKSYTDDDLLRISAYLALVFRSSKTWLLDRYSKRYSRYQIGWSVNVGLPVADAQNNRLSNLYKQMLHTAWVISVLPGPMTLNRVKQYMNLDKTAFDAFPAVYQSRIIAKDRIVALSGIAAQVFGCAHAHTDSKGLHLMIDIGAGTFNIATFDCGNNYNTEKVHCSLYSFAAKPIGVCYLLKRRYENLQLADDEINLFKDIPDTHAFSQAHELTDKEIQFADTLYSGDVAKQINKVLDETRELYCPDSIFWEIGVPTVFCGGGAHLEILETIRRSFENKPAPHKIHGIGFGVPDDLMVENLPEQSFDRLSVAYGLSFSSAEIVKAFRSNVLSNVDNVTETQ